MQTRRSFLKMLATGAATLVAGVTAVKVVAKALPVVESVVERVGHLSTAMPYAYHSTTWRDNLDHQIMEHRLQQANTLRQSQIDQYFTALNTYKSDQWAAAIAEKLNEA